MHRTGQGSMRAALIYHHATTERDRVIADALSAHVEAERDDERDREDPDDDGSYRRCRW